MVYLLIIVGDSVQNNNSISNNPIKASKKRSMSVATEQSKLADEMKTEVVTPEINLYMETRKRSLAIAHDAVNKKRQRDIERGRKLTELRMAKQKGLLT